MIHLLHSLVLSVSHLSPYFSSFFAQSRRGMTNGHAPLFEPRRLLKALSHGASFPPPSSKQEKGSPFSLLFTFFLLSLLPLFSHASSSSSSSFPSFSLPCSPLPCDIKVCPVINLRSQFPAPPSLPSPLCEAPREKGGGGGGGGGGASSRLAGERLLRSVALQRCLEASLEKEKSYIDITLYPQWGIDLLLPRGAFHYLYFPSVLTTRRFLCCMLTPFIPLHK